MIRGSKRATNVSYSSSVFGKGGEFKLSIDAWRDRVRQTWILGLIGRDMRLGKGHNRLGDMVYNSYTLASAGEAFLENPHVIELPDVSAISHPNTHAVENAEGSNTKPKRQGKGCHAIPAIRSLMSSSENWYTICREEDYEFPGTFSTPAPQRMGYCSDITTLPKYDHSNEHFLFTDIQFGKGKARNLQRTKMSVDGTEEELWYRIVPCGGVKLCGDHENGCSYVTSTRETRSCPSHPKSHLVKSGECPVEFIYIWPTEESDKRRWITGVRRLGGCEDENLHNHPTHAATKISSKVDTDIRRAVVANPHLKTKDLMTGKSMTIISNAINLWF